MEVGTHSPWVSRLLEEAGHEVLVANPRRLKLIYGETDRSDGRDAQHLARVGRMDPKLLSAVQHRGAEAQADLTLQGSREAGAASVVTSGRTLATIRMAASLSGSLAISGTTAEIRAHCTTLKGI
jgi:hypothetical protein